MINQMNYVFMPSIALQTTLCDIYASEDEGIFLKKLKVLNTKLLREKFCDFD